MFLVMMFSSFVASGYVTSGYNASNVGVFQHDSLSSGCEPLLQKIYYTREQVQFILSCNSETNHEGKIDYIQFVEMYYGPARSIGQYTTHTHSERSSLVVK